MWSSHVSHVDALSVRTKVVSPVSNAWFRAPTHARTVSSGLSAGDADVGDGLTGVEEFVADGVGSEMSGFGSLSSHAPSTQAATRAATTQRVRDMRVLPEKENLDRKLPLPAHRRDPCRWHCG